MSRHEMISQSMALAKLCFEVMMPHEAPCIKNGCAGPLCFRTNSSLNATSAYSITAADSITSGLESYNDYARSI